MRNLLSVSFLFLCLVAIFVTPSLANEGPVEGEEQGGDMAEMADEAENNDQAVSGRMEDPARLPSAVAVAPGSQSMMKPKKKKGVSRWLLGGLGVLVGAVLLVGAGVGIHKGVKVWKEKHPSKDGKPAADGKSPPTTPATPPANAPATKNK